MRNLRNEFRATSLRATPLLSPALPVEASLGYALAMVVSALAGVALAYAILLLMVM